MDAGVPITKPVAGISSAWCRKATSTSCSPTSSARKITSATWTSRSAARATASPRIQLDIKTEGIDHKIIRDTLHRAKEARADDPARRWPRRIAEPRPEISKCAPRLLTIKIDPEKIGKIIGPGGKNIKALQADTGANIDIEDDGTVYISAVDGAAAEKCRDIIEAMTAEVKVGKIYNGRVVSDQGIRRVRRDRPGDRWPVPRLELSDQYVDRVTDVVQHGRRGAR